MEFKKLTEEYLEWARQLHNDSSVLAMLNDPTVVLEEQQKEWFKSLKSSKTSERIVVLNEDSVPFGLIRVDCIDRNNLSVCVGLDIHKDFRGKGYAKKIYKHIFEYWFIKKNFNRVWLTVAEYNIVARCLYSSLGFLFEGIQRKSLCKDGKFYDAIMMGILKEEYVFLYKEKNEHEQKNNI